MKKVNEPKGSNLMQSVVKKMKELRLERKWSRMDAAIETDINPNYYARIERGKTKNMRASTLFKIVKGFGVTTKELFEHE